MYCTLILLPILYTSSACFAGDQTENVLALVERASNAIAQVQTAHVKGRFSVTNRPERGLMVAGPMGRIDFELWRDEKRRFVVQLRESDLKRWTVNWDGRELTVLDHERRQWASHQTTDIRNLPILASRDERHQLAQWAYMQLADTWLDDAAAYRRTLDAAIAKATRVEVRNGVAEGGKPVRILSIWGTQRSGNATMEQQYELHYDAASALPVRTVMAVTVRAGPLQTRTHRTIEYQLVETNVALDGERLRVEVPDGYARVEAENLDVAQQLVGRSARGWTLELIRPQTRRQSFADFAAGKPVVGLVWATWCGPCKIAMRHLQELLDDDGTIDGVRVLTIGIDSDRGKLLAYARDQKLRLPVAFDPGFFKTRLNGSGGPPLLVFVDTGGRIVSAKMGYGPQLKPWLAQQIAQLRSQSRAPAERRSGAP